MHDDVMMHVHALPSDDCWLTVSHVCTYVAHPTVLFRTVNVRTDENVEVK